MVWTIYFLPDGVTVPRDHLGVGWDVSYSTAEECVSVCECVGHIHIWLSSDTGVGHCGDVLGGVGGETGGEGIGGNAWQASHYRLSFPGVYGLEHCFGREMDLLYTLTS